MATSVHHTFDSNPLNALTQIARSILEFCLRSCAGDFADARVPGTCLRRSDVLHRGTRDLASPAYAVLRSLQSDMLRIAHNLMCLRSF